MIVSGLNIGLAEGFVHTGVVLYKERGLGGGYVGLIGGSICGSDGRGNISQTKFLMSSQFPSSQTFSGHCKYTQF